MIWPDKLMLRRGVIARDGTGPAQGIAILMGVEIESIASMVAAVAEIRANRSRSGVGEGIPASIARSQGLEELGGARHASDWD